MRKVTIVWYGYVLNGDSNVKGHIKHARNVHLKQSRLGLKCVSYMRYYTRWICRGGHRVRMERNFKVSKSGSQRIIHTYKT